MVNSVRLLNYLDPDGEFLRFYTELDSNFNIGDRVFIVGGNYDNVKYTDENDESYDPFNPLAAGYTVISIDKTTTSNAITLNIDYTNSQFNANGLETTVFNPITVYKTEEELLLEPNQIREAYITKSYFKRGEFNGGSFRDGLFGEYNIEGESTSKTYERQYFVDKLKENYSNQNNLELVNKIDNYDYSQLENPSLNNSAIFNNNFQNNPASFLGGVFLGGDWQYGQWTSKYNFDKVGNLQVLNESGGIFDPLDDTRYNIVNFEDNNDGLGYNKFVSGNWGLLYKKTEHYLEITSNSIKIDYFPYQLHKALDFGFKLQIKIESSLNNSILNIKNIEKIGNDNFIYIEDVVSYESYDVKQTLYNEIGVFNIELYTMNTEDKPNIFESGVMLKPDFFSGVFSFGVIEGGDIWNGEFLSGTISSKYSKCNFWNGTVNGSEDTLFAENLNWYDGLWLDGNWKGDSVVNIKDLELENGSLKLTISNEYKHLFDIDQEVFISYIKNSVTNRYLDNYTDDINSELINFQTFKLLDIVKREFNDDHILVLDTQVNNVSNFNVEFAKVSQSFFNKGIWNSGIWESGLRKVNSYEILSVNSNPTDLLNNQFDITLQQVSDLRVGEQVQVSNLNYVREIDISLLDNITIDNRTDERLLESIDSVLEIIEINGNIITVRFTDDNTISNITNVDGGQIIDIIKIDDNSYTGLYNCLWLNGEFRSGAWRGGLWSDGILRNFLYFDNLNQDIQSIWQSGYWKNGEWFNSVFLSGTWQNGTFNDGIISNSFNNQENNNQIGYNVGDTIWLDGTFNDGEFRRGIFNDGIFNDGLIINGSIKSVNLEGGDFSNGLSEFDSTNNVNKSGVLNTNDEIDNLSAPSLIFIDGNGNVQLDQPSFYQKGYNIIFQDLDKYQNPFNNQMFTVRNRDKFGTKLTIDYGSTSGDNVLLSKEEFIENKPILVIDNIIDICEIVNNGTDHIIWVADSGHNRILEVNQITNNVDVLGLIIGNEEKSKFEFNNIQLLTCANVSNSTYVYLVDDNEIKIIAKDKSFIRNLNLEFDDSNEEIINIQVVSTNNTLQETLFVLTNNKIYYWFLGDTTFKSIELPSELDGSTNIDFSLLRLDNNSIQMFIKYTPQTTDNTIKHFILDYIVSNNTYEFRANSFLIDTLDDAINNNEIITYTTAFIDGFVKIWITIFNEVSDRQEVILFDYKNYYNTSDNETTLLNDNNLDYNISSIKKGFNNEYLIVIGLDEENPLYFASADLDKFSFGFGNLNSSVKLLNTFQDFDSISLYNYWYFDDFTDNKRIIYVDENNPTFYNSTNNVDTLENNTDILKIVSGSNRFEAFSIETKNLDFFVRRTVNNRGDIDNETIYDINIGAVNNIYDIVYSKNKLFIVGRFNGLTRVVAIENFNDDEPPFSSLLYSSVNTIFGGSASTDYKIDVIEKGSDFIGILYVDNDIYELRLLDDGSSFDSKLIYTGLNDVEDIAITTNERGGYDLFLAIGNSIYRVVSDIEITTNVTHYRWSEITNSTISNDLNDKVFESTSNIEEIYRNNVGDKLIIKHNNDFSIIDTSYENTNQNLQDAVTTNNGRQFALSNGRLVEVIQNVDDSEKLVPIQYQGEDIGVYKQINRINYFNNGETPSANDSILSNPRSLILIENFIGGDDYIFFLDDNYGTTDRILRYYNINTSIFDLVDTRQYLDISFNKADNNLIAAIQVGSGTTFTKMNNSFSFFLNRNITQIIKHLSHANLTNTNSDYFYYTTVNDEVFVTDFSSTFNSKLIGSGARNFGSVIDSMSSYYDSGSDKTQVFISSEGILSYIELESLPVNNYNSWSEVKGVNGFEDIGFLQEYSNDSSLYGNNVQVYENESLSASTSFIELVETGSLNDDFIKATDFSFTEIDNSTDNLFLYNEPNIGVSGVIRQQASSNTEVNLLLNNQINNISSGVFQKIIAVDNDVAFVLFSDGLYKYDFLTDTVNQVLPPQIEYRNSSEQFPLDLSTYSLKAVDISTYDVNNDSRLLILYKFFNNNVASDRYVTHLYDSNTNTFTSSDIDYLYEGNNDAIFNTGEINTNRYDANSSGATTVGGIKYLFSSDVEPKLSAKNKTVYLYFNDNGSNADFLKIIQTSSAQPLLSNSYNNLIFRITVQDFNKNIENISSVLLTPDPTQSDDSLEATLIHLNSFVVDGNDYLSGFGADTFIVEFDKPVESLYELGNNYTFSYKFSLDSSQFINSSTKNNTFSSVYDFRVYEDTSSSAFDKIVIRETFNENPINVEKRYQRFFELDTAYIGIGTSRIESFPELVSEEKILLSLTSIITKNRFYIATLENDNLREDIDFIDIPFLDVDYNFNTFNKGYKVIQDDSIDVISPHITDRILFNTIIKPDVTFNFNGTPFTAHLISSKWDNGLFIGSWDTSFYLDHNVIDINSLFIDGIFEGIFQSGFFLGGEIRNSDDFNTLISNGHLVSSENDIEVTNSIVVSDYRNDIIEASWSNNILKLKVESLLWDESTRTYENSINSNIRKNSWTRIPSLFKKNEIEIIEIIKGKTTVNGKSEIILKTVRPDYYDEGLYDNQVIFVESYEFSNYLYGEQKVVDSFTEGDFMYLTIINEFNEFNGDSYIPNIFPKILINDYIRIKDINNTIEDGKNFTYVNIDLKVPASITGLKTRLRFLQSYYILRNHDVLIDGSYQGFINIDNHLQLFLTSINKTTNEIDFNTDSELQNIFISNVLDNNSRIFVNRNSGESLAHDITVQNSYITSSNSDNTISNSVFLSGRTDRNWLSGLWLNKDVEGFSNGISTFGSINNDTDFDGEVLKILNIDYNSTSGISTTSGFLNEFISIEFDTSTPIDVKEYEYFTLRGFTGNKSEIIGAERSKSFRVQEVDNNRITIKNPFLYYQSIDTDNNDYFNNFNPFELSKREQNMLIKDNEQQTKVETQNLALLFEYAYGSVSCWNGGDFRGNFKSIWNSGTFIDGEFSGLWFGSSENYSWQGTAQISSVDLGDNFEITIDLTNAAVDVDDFVYVKLNSVFIDNQLTEILEGFYDNIVVDSNRKVVKYITDTFLQEGTYAINVVRYRSRLNSTNDLILNYDSNKKLTDSTTSHINDSNLFSEQYFNNEDQTAVSRYSFFENGIFNSDVFYNGIFVNGIVNNDDFVFKYGIKHNGNFNVNSFYKRFSGTSLLNNDQKLSVDVSNGSFYDNVLKIQPVFSQPYGENLWRRYLYEYDGSNFTFEDDRFIGELTTVSETFDSDFTTSGPTFNSTTYTDTFMIRHKMTKFYSGTYRFSLGSDDGRRLSLDGGETFIINEPGLGGYTIPELSGEYYLNGYYNLVYEYYENTGVARVSFEAQQVSTVRTAGAQDLDPNDRFKPIVSGPGIELEPGDYNVIVRYKADTNNTFFQGDIIFGVDAYNQVNDTILFTDYSRLSQTTLSNYEELEIEFTVPTNNRIDIRILYDNYFEIDIDYLRINKLSNDDILIHPPKLQWLGGYHISSDRSSGLSNLNWYRGFFNGGRIEDVDWLSLDLDNDYIDQNSTSFTGHWSTFNKGEWYANLNIDINEHARYEYDTYNSKWHGGLWRSDVISGREYTYEGNVFDIYQVRNNNTLQLPRVNSIWLGGLWLRGEFEGGIFANGLWNSVSLTSNNNTEYENAIGYDYKENSSLFKSGQMINSIWEGGTVTDNSDKLETIFGDLTGFFSTYGEINDFIWNRDFSFKSSDIVSSGAFKSILGKNIFTGYHNNITNRELTTIELETVRVKSQVNDDGISSVYWKRGEWNNGLFQFSSWENLDLDFQDSKEIIEDESENNSIFRKGIFYNSKWSNGLWINTPTSQSYPLLLDEVEPNSLFYRSEWTKGYWKASELGLETDDIDDIRIVDGLFSRSIWSAGVFEGGVFDYSIWRSGVEDANITMHYKNESVVLQEVNQIGEQTLSVGESQANLPNDSNINANQLSNIVNDDTFLTQMSDSDLRLLGNVDNFASIWVNGTMRGSVWHGGIWQRGMFSHKNYSIGELDIFDEVVNVNQITDEYQPGVFVRGLWLSGYFSYYDDRLIYDEINNGNISFGQNNEYLNNKDRCIWLSLQAGNSFENNLLGKTESELNFLQNDLANNNADNIENYASLFSRELLKRTTTTSSNGSYFSIFNGSMMNGIIYDNSATIESNKLVFSIFSSVGNFYYSIEDEINTNSPIQTLNTNDFIDSLKLSPSFEYFLPYTFISPIVNNGSTWVDVNVSYLEYIYNNNNSYLNTIWRHNHSNIGDETVITNLDPFILDGNPVQVSIAQGSALTWNPKEIKGEPRYGFDIPNY